VKTIFQDNRARLVGIGLLVVLALFSAYRYSVAENSPALAESGSYESDGGQSAPVAGDNGDSGSNSGSAGCTMGCCGGGSSTPVEGSATVEGGVQTISVNASGGFDPNVIKLQAGVPAEITFSQSSGCTAYVYSADLGFEADLTAGPQTVELPALEPGTYEFACGMDMVFGQIVVE
jgi:hypothetical protein